MFDLSQFLLRMHFPSIFDSSQNQMEDFFTSLGKWVNYYAHII